MRNLHLEFSFNFSLNLFDIHDNNELTPCIYTTMGVHHANWLLFINNAGCIMERYCLNGRFNHLYARYSIHVTLVKNLYLNHVCVVVFRKRKKRVPGLPEYKGYKCTMVTWVTRYQDCQGTRVARVQSLQGYLANWGIFQHVI